MPTRKRAQAMNDLTIVIAIVSAALLALYFACIFKGTTTKPELLEAIGLILTSSGMVSAVKLGYLALFQASLFTGDLEDQRIPILAGAFAILWVSVHVTWKTYSQHLHVAPAESDSNA